MEILIAIPCLNEENNIEGVLHKIPKSIENVGTIHVLVVDDGSVDATSRIAESCGARVINHKTNMGLGCAFQTAVEYASEHGYDILVNMDGDGQFNPIDIKCLIQPILNGNADVTTASRFKDKALIPQMPSIKYWGNKGMSCLVSFLCGKKYYDVSCGFRAYSKETLLKINFYGKYTYTQEAFLFFTLQNLTVIEVPIQVSYFKDRESRVAGSIWKYTKKTIFTIFTLFRDYFPLKLFGMVSGLFFVIAVIFGSIFMTHYIRTGLFTGALYAGLISAFSVLCSLAFFCCGLSMEIMVRVQQNQNRILYLLKRGRLDEK